MACLKRMNQKIDRPFRSFVGAVAFVARAVAAVIRPRSSYQAPLMQNYPDQVTEAMRNHADGFVVSEARH